MTEPQTGAPTTPVARNEPCPCGSGKKYKRCHGVGAAPVLSAPKADPELAPAPGGGMPKLPDGVDPGMVQRFAGEFQKLPKGQQKKFQSIMRRAMFGRDVTADLEEMQKELPVELQKLLGKFGEAAKAKAEKDAKEKKADSSASTGEAGTAGAAGSGTGSGSKFGRLWKKLTRRS